MAPKLLETRELSVEGHRVLFTKGSWSYSHVVENGIACGVCLTPSTTVFDMYVQDTVRELTEYFKTRLASDVGV